ncbi:MAG: Ty3/Gypsy family RNase HI domain-containing protein, partial [Alphaproteobacteria bacterium]
LHVDASLLNGLGFLLKQKAADGKWMVVLAGSRFLSSAESNYAMIDLECLAAAWAMDKCRQFLEGLPTFELVTDHKPLIPILNSYALDKLANPRLLRLRLKMQRYAFKARWIPGKENVDADALSRAPVRAATPQDELAEGAFLTPPRQVLQLCIIDGSDPKVIDPVLEKVKSAALIDPVMKELREVIRNGFPNDKCNLSAALRPFWCVRNQLAIDETDGMIVMGARIVIPKALQNEILRDLLLMHQGATKLH